MAYPAHSQPAEVKTVHPMHPKALLDQHPQPGPQGGDQLRGCVEHPLTLALCGVADSACLNQAAALALAKSALQAAQARSAVQRFDERYCVVKHQSS